ncbi:MAG: phosphoglycerate kinase [Candidatus ainarchaeum sp.]|nr:phosphoglycerate kinase [Candidatus ainarchaeum sp.]
MAYKFISSENVKEKTLVVRLDLNSSIESGKLIVSSRIREHGKTVEALCKKGARLVLLAHQGRKGDEDFTSLEQHALALARLSKTKVFFCPWKSDFAKAIADLKFGQALLLDNTRFQSDEAIEKTPEEHSKSQWVNSIASVSDFFVEDALSACHRSHASVVGFGPLLPCFAGMQLEKEIIALEKFETSKNRLFVLGGAKIDDSVKMIGFLLENRKADAVCLGGLLGELFLKAKGIMLGAKDNFFSEKGFDRLVPKAGEILNNFSQQIFLPLDVAVDENGKRKEVLAGRLPSNFPIMDIGAGTIFAIKEKISSADFFVFNGPLGIFEKKGFELGTKEIFAALKKSGKQGILGGGDTETALQGLGFSLKDFYHVSLAGKALLEYLSGKKLPGLEILK